MEAVILVIHLILALAIIGLVLLQRSEGGGLGIGGGGGGIGNLSSAKSTANALTKATAFCAFAFFGTSLTLGILAGHGGKAQQGLLSDIDNVLIEEEVDAEDLPAVTDTDEADSIDEENSSAPSAPIAE